MKPEVRYMTKQEAADHLRISKRSVDRLMASGAIVGAQVTARRILFRQDDLDRYMAKKFQEAAR